MGVVAEVLAGREEDPPNKSLAPLFGGEEPNRSLVPLAPPKIDDELVAFDEVIMLNMLVGASSTDESELNEATNSSALLIGAASFFGTRAGGVVVAEGVVTGALLVTGEGDDTLLVVGKGADEGVDSNEEAEGDGSEVVALSAICLARGSAVLRFFLDGSLRPLVIIGLSLLACVNTLEDDELGFCGRGTGAAKSAGADDSKDRGPEVEEEKSGRSGTPPLLARGSSAG